MDDAAWGALTLSLTALGGIYTWFAFRSRGFVAGLRGLGITLLPLALLLTDTLQMVTRIGSAISHWALNLAFNPFTWAGIVLAGVSVVCFVVAGYVANRGVAAAPEAKALPRAKGTKAKPVVADVDPELAEIEALLKKRGTS